MKFGFLNIFRRDKDDEDGNPEAMEQGLEQTTSPEASEESAAEQGTPAAAPAADAEAPRSESSFDELASILRQDEGGEAEELVDLEPEPDMESGAVESEPITSSADTIYVPAERILPSLPQDYLAAPASELVKAGRGQPDFAFSFNRSDLMYSLSRGKLEMAVGDLATKIPLNVFRSDIADYGDQVLSLPLNQIVPLIPAEWMIRNDQDMSKERTLEEMPNYFTDLGTPVPEAPELLPEEEEEERLAAASAASPEQQPADAVPTQAFVTEQAVPAAPAPEVELGYQDQFAPVEPEAPAEPEYEEEEAVDYQEEETLGLGAPTRTAAAQAPVEQLDFSPPPQPEDITGEFPFEEEEEAVAAAPEQEVVSSPEPPVWEEEAPLPEPIEEPVAEEELAEPPLAAVPHFVAPPVVEEPALELDEVEAEEAASEAIAEPVAEPEAPVVPPLPTAIPAPPAAAAVLPAMPQPEPVLEPVGQLDMEEPGDIAKEVFGNQRQPFGMYAKEIQPPTPPEPRATPWRSQAPNGINLNRTGIAELCVLPGIGEHLAHAILAYRRERGDFRDLRDLLEVPGLGNRTYRAMCGLTPTSALADAELELNRQLGIESEIISLTEIARKALEKLKLQGLFVTGADGFLLAKEYTNPRVAKLADNLAAVAPQLYKRGRRSLTQGKLPDADMYTFYLGKFAVTFAGSEEILVACVHKGPYPSGRDLRAFRKIVRELVWYCSYRAVL